MFAFGINETDQALRQASRALREATWAFEREMAACNTKDLPTGAITALRAATDAMATALETVGSFQKEA